MRTVYVLLGIVVATSLAACDNGEQTLADATTAPTSEASRGGAEVADEEAGGTGDSPEATPSTINGRIHRVCHVALETEGALSGEWQGEGHSNVDETGQAATSYYFRTAPYPETAEGFAASRDFSVLIDGVAPAAEVVVRPDGGWAQELPNTYTFDADIDDAPGVVVLQDGTAATIDSVKLSGGDGTLTLSIEFDCT